MSSTSTEQDLHSIARQPRKNDPNAPTQFGERLTEKDAKSLRMLAARTTDSQNFSSDLVGLVIKAAAGKDARFQDLLAGVPSDPTSGLGLSLSAYDYALTRNPAALRSILDSYERLAAEGTPGDSNELMVLAVVDEWDLTRKALIAGRMSGDGTGGDAARLFFEKRRFLFPHNKDFPTDQNQFLDELLNREK